MLFLVVLSYDEKDDDDDDDSAWKWASIWGLAFLRVFRLVFAALAVIRCTRVTGDRSAEKRRLFMGVNCGDTGEHPLRNP